MPECYIQLPWYPVLIPWDFDALVFSLNLHYYGKTHGLYTYVL